MCGPAGFSAANCVCVWAGANFSAAPQVGIETQPELQQLRHVRADVAAMHVGMLILPKARHGATTAVYFIRDSGGRSGPPYAAGSARQTLVQLPPAHIDARAGSAPTRNSGLPPTCGCAAMIEPTSVENPTA